MLSSKYTLLIILILPCTLTATVCQNNSTYVQQYDFCSCPPGFIGRSCNITAQEVTDVEMNITVTNIYTFVYFKPPERVLYRFLLTVCGMAKSQEVDIIVSAQQEQKNGQIQLFPRKPGESDQFPVGGSNPYRQETSTILLNIDKKPNGELMKIILGFKLAQQSKAVSSSNITIKCQTISFFNVNIIATILVSFFAIVGAFILISIVFVVRRKLLQMRSQRQEEMKKIQCVNQLMPTTKYQTLIQERNQQNENDLICSICLSEFENGQDVRKTPCGHIYHSNCLESWCNSHLNCPICRKNFEKEQEIELAQQALKPDTTNIRAPIL